jgi:hypothetical protein
MPTAFKKMQDPGIFFLNLHYNSRNLIQLQSKAMQGFLCIFRFSIIPKVNNFSTLPDDESALKLGSGGFLRPCGEVSHLQQLCFYPV